MKSKKWIIAINLVLFLGYFLYSINDKENILTQGEKVLLKLAPADPRSLLQGDYMQLNYEMNNEVRKIEEEGEYLVISKNESDVGQFKRIQMGTEPLADNEYLIKFKRGSRNSIRIGAESFFFEEGKAKLYEDAEYGALRIDDKGNSVLVGLYSEDFTHID